METEEEIRQRLAYLENKAEALFNEWKESQQKISIEADFLNQKLADKTGRKE